MTSNHASPTPSEPAASLRMPMTRISLDNQSIASSVTTLPYRTSNPSVSSLFASTATPPGSRSISPNGTSTPRGSVFGGTPGEGNLVNPSDQPEDARNLISQAYVPHIAVHTSIDTKELVKDKGFDGGLWELLRPFGERVQGKVNVRDSIGASRTWDDFAVRFVELGDGLEAPEPERKSVDGKGSGINGLPTGQRMRTGGNLEHVEILIERHLDYSEQFPSMPAEDYLTYRDTPTQGTQLPSPFYTLYLRRLLSGIPLAPHETFSHPVACIIAISSRNPHPIDALRKLYDESSHGERRLPAWVNNEYLRYYVLVHDEERDDITKSITLFDQMKRHFGLHCHLLRLRSSQCVATDDDSVPLPRCQWIAAAEELSEIQARESEEDVEDTSPCIYESDTTAIKTFIREMVTQSVVPSMERCVSTWNDQVASRRRGISGRFISLSKKWTGFGSSRNSTPASSTVGGSYSNYDAAQGFYRPDAPEALMRKLADYAFMLRDFKLAHSTYDLLRSDFNNDKAWRYHAAANEMAAISTLLVPRAMSSKTRTETVDQMLETASYSYITRCGASYGALRSLALGMELLRLRDGSATADAARWGAKLLEYKVVGAVGDALVKERVAVCYASKKGAGSGHWGSRTRKSALWSILAADAWLMLGKHQQAKLRLEEADRKSSMMAHKDSVEQFSEAHEFLRNLRGSLQSLQHGNESDETTQNEEAESLVDEESETLNVRSHRRSLMNPPLGSLETAPLQATLEDIGSKSSAAEQFQ
ncbi:Transport protein particle subunit trs85-2 [Phlyctema vagabunda]|uniref:Transport protein particle subunit trs85-2 n=1 Tax=Phlyctema vagabunda TaxID=108571 RepID=A0ABR4PRW7_9HELO